MAGKAVTISVRFITGKTLSLEMKMTDNIEAVRRTVHAIEGVPLETLGIIYGGRALDDTLTLEEHLLHNKEGHVLWAHVKLRGGAHAISIFSLTGKPLAVDADEADAVAVVKKRIERSHGMPHCPLASVRLESR